MVIKCFGCLTDLQARSAAELKRLIDVELLPSCDPRLSATVPSASIYFGVNEAVKIALENAVQLAVDTSSCQLQEDSQKTVGPVKDGNKPSAESMRRSHEDAGEPGIHKKSHIRPSSQKTLSTQKQTSSVSKKHRASVKDTDSSSLALESVNEKPVVAATPSGKQPRTGTESIGHRERFVKKVHVPRKRKRKVFGDLTEDEDRFPSMNYLMNDETAFWQYLSQLSFFAELDKNPDDPMLLISLCELDDIVTFQRQDFVSDLNSIFIGRKPRFTLVHSPYCDRSFSRLGQLSLQTYCDGHFIECARVSRVHMACLHQWASTEPLEKIGCNVWSDSQQTAMSLPYPSVRNMCEIVCSWLSSELCYVMLDVGIECIDPPDIFIGSSVESELTTNCLYQMFCRYVDFLCEKSEKYFRDEDYGKAAARIAKATGRRVETETSAAHGSKRAKLLRYTSSSLRKKDLRKQTTKQSFRRRTNDEYYYEDMPFGPDDFGVLDDDAVEQMMSLHEMAMFSDDFSEKATGYGHRKDDAPATRRKRKFPKDDDHEHRTSRDVQTKARRIHRDRTRLLAREKDDDGDVHRKKRGRQRARQNNTSVAKSTRHSMPSVLKHEDSPEFILYDEDGSIVVQCSDTGRTVVMQEAESGKAAREDEMKSGVDHVQHNTAEQVLNVLSPLYGVVHDHSYTAIPLCSLESVAPVTPDLSKKEHLSAVPFSSVESVAPVAPSVDKEEDLTTVPLCSLDLVTSVVPDVSKKDHLNAVLLSSVKSIPPTTRNLGKEKDFTVVTPCSRQSVTPVAAVVSKKDHLSPVLLSSVKSIPPTTPNLGKKEDLTVVTPCSHESVAPIAAVVSKKDHLRPVLLSSVKSVPPTTPSLGKEEDLTVVTPCSRESVAPVAPVVSKKDHLSPVLLSSVKSFPPTKPSLGKEEDLTVVTPCSRESVAPVAPELGKENHIIAVGDKNSENNTVLHVAPLQLTSAGENSDAKVPSKDHRLSDDRKSRLSLHPAVENPAKKIRPLSSLSVVNTASVPEVTAKGKPNEGKVRKKPNEDKVKSPEQPVTKKHLQCKKLERPQQATKKENVMDRQKNRHHGERQTTKKENVMDPQKNREHGERRTTKKENVMDPRINRDHGKSEPSKLNKRREKTSDAEPEHCKKFERPQQTRKKENVMDARKNRDRSDNEPSKVNKSAKTSDAAEVSHKASVTVSDVDGRSSKNKHFSGPLEKKVTNASKISSKKIKEKMDNRKEVSEGLDEVAANITEAEKVSADKDKISEDHVVYIDDDKDADAAISVDSDKSAAEAVPSAATLAAAARDASHYEDAYLSEMADAYGVWPLSNFSAAFDPTDVPEDHTCNPFRKTWPILQHVIDGKTDLLLKVCSFPDVSLFSIRRVMRENGFLWAVCLSLFDPLVSKPLSAENNLYSGLDAANKGKAAKSSNPLMQAFRQAVEAKKKVAEKSKRAVVRQNSDDAGGIQVWSAKRPASKMSIVFGSAVKSGGSLSSVVGAEPSVVGAEPSAKTEPPTNMFSNLLTSAVSKMNSDISDMISRKCGEQCLDKDAHATEYRSSLPVPATSKHLSMLSDFAIDMYDIAEYKLEKIFAKEADKESIKKSVKGNESVAVSETSAVAVTTVAAAVSQPHISTSSPANDVISSSSPLLPSVNASKPSTGEVTPPLSSDDVRSASTTVQVSQSPVSQTMTAQSDASTAPSVTTAVNVVCTSTSTDVVTSVSVAVSAAVPVTVKVTAVADMLPPPMLPPPMPPLSLSRIGVGFETHIGAVITSGSSKFLTSWSSSSSVNSASVGQVSTNAAYQAAVGRFAYPLPVSTAAFSNPSLPLGQLMHMPPPSVQTNLYSMPPPVGMPLNMPPPGFVNTSIPPPPVASYPRTPWYPPSSSEAGRYPVPAVPVSKMPEVVDSAVSCASAPGSSQSPSGKATAASPAIENLQTTGIGITSSSAVVTSMTTQLNVKHQNATSVTYPSPLPHRPDVSSNQRPPSTVVQLSQASGSTAAKLVPELQPHPPFSLSSGQSMPQQSLVSPAGLKSAASSLVLGNRPLGPLKTVAPLTQPTPPRLPGPVVHQFRSVSTGSSEIGSAGSPQNSNIQPRGIVSGIRPTSEPTGFPVTSQGIRVPVRPATTSQSYPMNTSSPHAGQVPPGVVRPGLSVSQSAEPTTPDNQARGTIRQVSTQPVYGQPAAAGPLISQSPRVAVRPGPPMNNFSLPRGVLPGSQPRGIITPVSTQPNKQNDQLRATSPVVGQTPGGAVRLGLPMNQSNQPRGALPGSQPRATISPVFTQPNEPSDQPRATSPVVGQSPGGAVRPGPLMNPSSQTRGALPGIQPRGSVGPVSARPSRPENQPRAVGLLQVQSPSRALRPQTRGPATFNNLKSQSLQLSSVSGTPRGPAVCTESRFPSIPAGPAGAIALRPPRPLTAAGGVSAAQSGKGPLLTANSRIYVLNSDTSAMCKGVKVSL